MEPKPEKSLNMVVLTNLFPNPIQPNRGIFTAQLVKELRAWGHVVVISPLPWFPKILQTNSLKRWSKYAQVPDRWSWEGVDVYYPRYVVIPKLMGFLQSVTLFLSVLPLLRRLRDAGICDVVNAHWIYPDGVGTSLATKVLSLPYVLTALGCDINLYTQFRFRRPQIRWALRDARRITAVSRALAENIRKLGIAQEKISYIPNGVSSKKFFPRDSAMCRAHVGLDPGEEMVLYLGRFSDEKGVDTLIDALALVRKRWGRILKLHLVGDGPLRGRLAEQAGRLGLWKQVQFHEPCPHDEVPMWLGAATVSCLPSRREGMPNVVLEALACGRPVIASCVGGVPDLIRAGANGYLCEPGSARDFADALNTAMSGSWNASEIAGGVSSQTWERVAADYVREYIRALGSSEQTVQAQGVEETDQLKQKFHEEPVSSGGCPNVRH